MRVLVITNLFPSAEDPRAASFNRQQFAALGKQAHVEVLATQPWYPAQRFLGRYATHQTAHELPAHEVIDGLDVYHPRTLHLPKIGLAIAAPLFAGSLLPAASRYRGKIDVVLGSWAHPDGCAAVALAKFLQVPSVVKLHGGDVNVVSKLPGPRRMMKLLLPRADAIVAVSSALADGVVELGVDRERIHLVMNGVDDSRFTPRDRLQARRALDLPEDARILLYVGNLIEAKGVFDLSRAFGEISADRPDLHLYMVGSGNADKRLRQEAAARMHLVGSQPFDSIPLWMAACDLLVLPSWNEGTPNVVLEALACGRRVIATQVGGIPDLLTDPALGYMVHPKQPSELAAVLRSEIDVPYEGSALAARGARGNWDQSAAELRAVLASVL